MRDNGRLVTLCGGCKTWCSKRQGGKELIWISRVLSLWAAHRLSCHSLLWDRRQADLSDDRRVWAADREFPSATLTSTIILHPFSFLFFSPPPLPVPLVLIVVILSRLDSVLLPYPPHWYPSRRRRARLLFFFMLVKAFGPSEHLDDLSYPQPPNWCHIVSGDWQISTHCATFHWILSPGILCERGE